MNLNRNTLCSKNEKKVEHAKIVDPDEAAHNELPHLNPQCLPSSVLNSQYDISHG